MLDAITLFAHPACSKSATAASLLDQHDIEFTLRDYIAEPLSIAELESLIATLPNPPVDLVRSWAHRDATTVTADEVIEHLLAHPDELQRPIITTGTRSAIARPPHAALDFVGIRSGGSGLASASLRLLGRRLSLALLAPRHTS